MADENACSPRHICGLAVEWYARTGIDDWARASSHFSPPPLSVGPQIRLYGKMGTEIKPQMCLLHLAETGSVSRTGRAARSAVPPLRLAALPTWGRYGPSCSSQRTKGVIRETVRRKQTTPLSLQPSLQLRICKKKSQREEAIILSIIPLNV